VTVPSTAISALSGTTVVNGRISVDAATLSETLKKKDVQTIEIARALRSLAADAALGSDLSGRLSPWPEARDVQAQLDSFYQAMAETAKTGLRASLTDTAAYRKAGAAMLVVIKQLDDVDAASRALAESVGIELPPVAIPEA
jgi:cell division GTPase FtsZ